VPKSSRVGDAGARGDVRGAQATRVTARIGTMRSGRGCMWWPVQSVRNSRARGRRSILGPMAETTIDVRGLPKPDAYPALKSQLDVVCDGVRDPIAIMSTMVCILHLGLGHLWTGFYRRIGATKLIVGPYQGTLGCMEIEFGRGVCGTAAAERRTVIVPDVHA